MAARQPPPLSRPPCRHVAINHRPHLPRPASDPAIHLTRSRRRPRSPLDAAGFPRDQYRHFRRSRRDRRPAPFALPAASHPDPAASPVPDIAYLRRHFPEIGTLHLLGDGLDPSELDALRGLRVEFAPPDPILGTLGLRFLRCPRELNLGDPLVVQGQLGGLAPNSTATLTLEAPDGATTSAVTAPADATGVASFTIRAAPLPSTGHFLWHLRAAAVAGHPAIDLPLGVAVISPNLPRLLILESSPRFDTAALSRWFEAAGGVLISRTLVGQDRYRYASSTASPPPPFTALTASLLAGVDLLVADAHAIAALLPAERDTLLAAVANTGLGVLLLPDDTPPASANAFFPWKLSPLAVDTPGNDRPTRLQWPGQSVPTDLPIPVAPFEILPAATQRPLLSDHQGHLLAATDAHGRGQIALTLVRDTTRWQRENDPAAFAAYWSFLFSSLTRPADAAAGRWSLLDGDAGPVFVDHPLQLLWSAPPEHSPGAALVTTPITSEPTTLALTPDPAGPGRWRGTFWPRRAGWHQVALATGGPSLDFFVSTPGAWPALAAERRQIATARFAEISAATAPAFSSPSLTRREFPPLWLAASFLVSVGYLWIERRLTA